MADHDARPAHRGDGAVIPWPPREVGAARRPTANEIVDEEGVESAS